MHVDEGEEVRFGMMVDERMLMKERRKQAPESAMITLFMSWLRFHPQFPAVAPSRSASKVFSTVAVVLLAILRYSGFFSFSSLVVSISDPVAGSSSFNGFSFSGGCALLVISELSSCLSIRVGSLPCKALES